MVCGAGHGFSARGEGWREGPRPMGRAPARRVEARRFCLGKPCGPCEPRAVNAANETVGAGPVLLFDGECALCRGVVRRLLRLDARGPLRFAPLQGAAAQAFLRAQGLPTADFDTLIFVPDWSRRADSAYLVRTAGVVAALRVCGRTGRMIAGALAILPVALRDAGYRGVARWRRRIWGAGLAGDAWREPWRARFLD